MIKTDRQLARSRGQLAKLLAAADAEPRVVDVHPTLIAAARAGLDAQIQDLQTEIAEYEALIELAISPDLSSIESLHLNLIRARIAKGLTQADLAECLGVAEQQIQRYEANEYAGASLTRLQEIARALGEPAVSEGTFVQNVPQLRQRLAQVGVSKTLTARLLPEAGRPHAFGLLATRVATALRLSVDALLGATVPQLVAPAPGFKLPVGAAGATLASYVAYARVLAEAALEGTEDRSFSAPPSNPDALHAAVPTDSEGLFRALLELAWECGIVVLPLSDEGSFHAAYWPIDTRKVILLKQGTRTFERWAFDLAHEICHLLDDHSGKYPLHAGVIDTETFVDNQADPGEARANRFAARVLLGPHADDAVEEVVRRAGRDAARLKDASVDVARRRQLNVGALANHLAFRLNEEGVNWWGAATNLQSTGDPWQIARDALLDRLQLKNIDPDRRDLLLQALTA